MDAGNRDDSSPVGESAREPAAPGAVRRSLLRWGILSVAFLAIFLGFIVFVERGRFRARDLLPVAISAISMGLVAIPFTVLEVFAARRPPSIRRDVVAGLLAGLIVMVAAMLGTFEAVYAINIAQRGDPARALREMGELLDNIARMPERFFSTFALGTSPFAPLFVARLRGLALWRQLIATLAGALVLGGPVLLWILSVAGRGERLGIVLGAVAIVLFAPLALAAADAIERRVARLLES